VTHDADDRERSAAGGADEPFLARWSRRKHATRTEVPEEPAPPPQTPPEALRDPPGDADMPSLDSLTEESDYSAFFSPRVSDDLRRAALRKLFHTEKYNVCDGLDDYWGDRRTYTPLGDTITADMRRAFERAAEQAAAAAKAVVATPEAPRTEARAADPPALPTDQEPDEPA